MRGFKIEDENEDASDIDNELYKDLIGSDSDGDKAKSKEKDPKDIESYRKKLLDGLQGDKSELFNKKRMSHNKNGGQLNDSENGSEIDWDGLNSDELDSEDLDNIEKHGKLMKNKKKEQKEKDEMKVSTGFAENLGQKFLKNKAERAK